MKKVLAMILALCMVFALCACGSSAPAATPAPAATEAPAAEEAPAEEAAPVEEAAEAAEYKLGMGVVVDMESTADGKGQVDATVAAVVVDANGAIVACRIDVAQNKMDIEEGAVDAEKSFLTKVELGDDYNMVKFGGAIGEWYEQAAAFEAYCIGKTVEEVTAIESVLTENGHNVAVDEELLAGCTMSIGDMKAAVVKACLDEQGCTFATADEFLLGLACNTTADESTNAADDADGAIKMYTNFAAVVVADGVVLADLVDAIQPQITFAKDGTITGTTFKATKRELKEDYNMVKFGGAIGEWYEQAAAFEAYCIGMTADQIGSIETAQKDEHHQIAVDEELLAGCTMSISGMMNDLVKAIGNAK